MQSQWQLQVHSLVHAASSLPWRRVLASRTALLENHLNFLFHWTRALSEVDVSPVSLSIRRLILLLKPVIV